MKNPEENFFNPEKNFFEEAIFNLGLTDDQFNELSKTGKLNIEVNSYELGGVKKGEFYKLKDGHKAQLTGIEKDEKGDKATLSYKFYGKIDTSN